MTVRSPYVSWYVNQTLKKFCQCDVVTVELPHKNAYGETEYKHTLSHAHFDKYGWPTEIFTQIDQKFPEFRMRLV